MRWQDERRSDNVEDQRGMPGGRVAIGGAGAVVVVVLALLFGVDPRPLLQQLANQPAPAPRAGQAGPGGVNDQGKDFVRAVLGDTEDVWGKLFQQMGREYRRPKLVLFSGEVASACGQAQSAVGPFYCPADEKVYIDLSFYDELKRRFGAPGEFAQAYVIAHEIGHHVQKLMGVSDKVSALQARAGKEQANALSVRLELQADFLAGVWAHHAQRMRNLIEPGDIDQAIRAASAIGDDKLQMQARGYVVPESFTHGTSEQRVRWFRKGYQTGDITQGDTFKAAEL